MSDSTDTKAKPKGIFFGWWLVAATFVSFAFTVSTIAIFAFGVFVVPLEKEFGWTRAQISGGYSAAALSAVAVALLQGVLIDRYGPRRLLLLSIPFFSLSVALLYFLPDDIYIFYAFWALIPFAGIGCWPLTFSKAAVAWFNRHLGLAIGLGAAGIGVGAVIVPFIAARLIENFGWRFAYLGLGILSLLITFTAAYFFIFDNPSDKGTTIDGDADSPLNAKPVASFGLTFREAIKCRSYWFTFAGFFGLGLVSSSVLAHQIPMLIDRGFTPVEAGKVGAAFGMAVIAGRLITGWFLDRFFAPLVMSVYLCGAIVAFCVYASGQTDALMFMCAILIGLVVGGEIDALAYIIRRYFGGRAFGTIYGTIFAIFNTGNAVGASVVGVLRTSTGSYSTPMWGAAIATAGCIVILMLLGPYPDLEGGPAE